MSPFTRFSWTLMLALLIWVPALIQLFRNDLALHIAILYLIGALVFAWIGMGLLEGLLNSYAREQQAALEKARRVQQEIREIEARKAAEEAASSHDNPSA